MSKQQQTDDDAQQQPADAVVELGQRVVALEQQVSELTAALQRERADAENMRRRHSEQVAALKETVKADVVRELLPIIDNVERALNHVTESSADDDFVKGVRGIAKQFTSTLEKLGVTRIKTVGEPFDPHFHEAVSSEEGDGNQEEVIAELQAGYTLGDRVIRHAMVKVRT